MLGCIGECGAGGSVGAAELLLYSRNCIRSPGAPINALEEATQAAPPIDVGAEGAPMATVSDILARKGGQVHCIPRSATVLEATRRMNEHKVGSLVVSEDGRVVGVFSERDVLQRVVAQERLPGRTLVGDVMTARVIVVSPSADIDEAARIMKDQRVRHLPVVEEDGRLVGMISIGDVNAYHASGREATIRYLHDYIYGRV
jgi:CBS domain-containing protein